MLVALVQVATGSANLAELAKGHLRAELAELREALERRFDPHHALLVGAILAQLDFLDEQILLLCAVEEQLGLGGAADGQAHALALSLRRLLPGARSASGGLVRPLLR